MKYLAPDLTTWTYKTVSPHDFVVSRSDFSGKKYFMNDKWHSVEIIYFPSCFFIGAQGEAFVGKSIYIWFVVRGVCLVSSYWFLKSGFLDLICCRLDWLTRFGFNFTFDFTIFAHMFTFIIHFLYDS